MLRKVFLCLAGLFLMMTTMATAEPLDLGDALEKLPPLKQGIMYEIKDNQITYLSTLEVASWKNITLELGYSPTTKIIGVISYPILKLKDLGVNLPILDLVEFNLGAGIGVDKIFGDNQAKYGLTLTLIKFKF